MNDYFTNKLDKYPNLKALINGKLSESTDTNGLPPLLGENPRCLILGTLPGKESLKRQEYYAHARNRFWRIISDLCNEVKPFTYEQKCDKLFRHGIALWDVLSSAERNGSLDRDISAGRPNDIAGFLKEHPGIKVIALNGNKAADYFDQYRATHELPGDIKILRLPSTSPANTGFSTTALTEKWRSISDYLDK